MNIQRNLHRFITQKIDITVDDIEIILHRALRRIIIEWMQWISNIHIVETIDIRHLRHQQK